MCYRLHICPGIKETQPLKYIVKTGQIAVEKEFIEQSIGKQNAQYYGYDGKTLGILRLQCITELVLKTYTVKME